MEEKLIIDKELFGELKLMLQSSNEHDIVMAISILETADDVGHFELYQKISI
jgi:hypothetical protein